MKKLLLVLGLSVCSVFLFSCKSGGKTSDLEGVDMSGLYPPPLSDFLPDNCKVDFNEYYNDKGDKVGSKKLYKDRDGMLNYLVLAETCSDPLDTQGKITPTPDTVNIKVTDRIVYPPSNDLPYAAAPEAFPS